MDLAVPNLQDGIIPRDQWRQVAAGADEVEFGISWLNLTINEPFVNKMFGYRPRVQSPPHGCIILRRDGHFLMALHGFGHRSDGTLQEVAKRGDTIRITALTEDAHFGRIDEAGHRYESISRTALTRDMLAQGLDGLCTLGDRLEDAPVPYTVPAEVVIWQMKDGLRAHAALADLPPGQRLLAIVVTRPLARLGLALWPDIFALGARHLTHNNVHSANEQRGWLYKAQQFAESLQLLPPPNPDYAAGANSNDIACRIGTFFGIPVGGYLQAATAISFNCGATAMERLERLSRAAGLATAAPVTLPPESAAAPARPATVPSIVLPELAAA